MKLDQGSLRQVEVKTNGVFVGKRPDRVVHCSGSDGVRVKATLRGGGARSLGGRTPTGTKRARPGRGSGTQAVNPATSTQGTLLILDTRP